MVDAASVPPRLPTHSASAKLREGLDLGIWSRTFRFAGRLFFRPENALQELFQRTKGYPYFLQEWGYQAWNLADQSPISLQIVRNATEQVTRRLDENFFRVRFDRLTPRERSYLRGMAELGSGPYRTADIADCLGLKLSTLGPVRARLIKKKAWFIQAYRLRC